MFKSTTSLPYKKQNIGKLFTVYDQGYAPPSWGKDVDKTMYDLQARTVLVYYDSLDNASTTLDNVKSLVRKREPVNIAMIRYYSEPQLKSLFGYSRGIYDQFNHSVNFAMFMTCFVDMEAYYTEKQWINILNVIAPAFDSLDQPDRSKYFKGTADDIDVDSVVKRFTLIFNMIYACVSRKNDIKNIYITGFGTGAFGNKEAWFIKGFLNSKLTKLTGKKMYF